ncbi:MAG: hypothetical protein Q8O46_00580 [bacterium]|nr:hypothetical protein [bacterium]
MAYFIILCYYGRGFDEVLSFLEYGYFSAEKFLVIGVDTPPQSLKTTILRRHGVRICFCKATEAGELNPEQIFTRKLCGLTKIIFSRSYAS